MDLSDLRPLSRWKHIEVLYERLSSGGLSVRQRNQLRAELERTLQNADTCRGERPSTSIEPGHAVPSTP